MIEFALLACVLVALVIVAVWKLRPRDIDEVERGSATEPLTASADRPPNLLSIARSENSPEFRESLAALVMRDRWAGARARDLEELRRIVTSWSSQAPSPGSATEEARKVPGPNPVDAFVSKVNAAAGAGVVEIRIRRGSDVSVLLPRQAVSAQRPFSLS